MYEYVGVHTCICVCSHKQGCTRVWGSEDSLRCHPSGVFHLLFAAGSLVGLHFTKWATLSDPKPQDLPISVSQLPSRDWPAGITMPSSLLRSRGWKLRSSCFQGKGFTDGALFPASLLNLSFMLTVYEECVLCSVICDLARTDPRKTDLFCCQWQLEKKKMKLHGDVSCLCKDHSWSGNSSAYFSTWPHPALFCSTVSLKLHTSPSF